MQDDISRYLMHNTDLGVLGGNKTLVGNPIAEDAPDLVGFVTGGLWKRR